MTLATFKCPKCNGTGKVWATHIADGRCFLCGGNGKLVTTKANLARCAKLGLMPRNELPEAERCTIKQLAEISRLAHKFGSDQRLATAAGFPETAGMDDWRYELSRKAASKIIEFGRAA